MIISLFTLEIFLESYFFYKFYKILDLKKKVLRKHHQSKEMSPNPFFQVKKNVIKWRSYLYTEIIHVFFVFFLTFWDFNFYLRSFLREKLFFFIKKKIFLTKKKTSQTSSIQRNESKKKMQIFFAVLWHLYQKRHFFL